MDKRKFSAIISEVYRNLTPTKLSVSCKNAEVYTIHIVSEAFKGMTFSDRFKLLDKELQIQQPGLFNERIYIFEAFTAKESDQIYLQNNPDNDDSATHEFKESAKELS